MSLKQESRLKRLRQKLASEEIDALLISQPENGFYLSGFSGSSGWLLITQEEAVLATDFRYLEQAKLQAPGYELFQISANMEDWLPKLLAKLSLKSLGFEGRHITFTIHKQLTKIMNKLKSRPKLTPLDGLVESFRVIKEPEEIELINQAAAISDGALEYTQDMIHTDMSEKEVAWEIEKFLRQHGSEALPFEVIVASGPNSALPHHQPSSRTIKPGEPIIIDIGARVGGYSSDVSRTICLDKADDKFNQIYDSVLGAQLTAIALIKEGMTGEDADKSARTVIEEAGYADAFGHGLGHGIGLEAHEQPHLAPDSKGKLQNGMAFTIEPALYFTGWGGVRIEDTVVLQDGKLRLISKARK